jgi:hypothetical protein
MVGPDWFTHPFDAIRNWIRRCTKDAYQFGKDFLGIAPEPGSTRTRLLRTILGALVSIIGITFFISIVSWLLGIYTSVYVIVWLFVQMYELIFK